MPPVSLPLKGGTQSARAGVLASIPHVVTKQAATRPAAVIIRIADSIGLSVTIECVGGREKNGRGGQA